MKRNLNFYLGAFITLLCLCISSNLKAQDYWIDDSFITNTKDDGYLATFSTALLPTSGGIQLTGVNSNFENISGTSASNDGKTSGVFVRVKDGGGYVQFTVSNAGTIRIALKAKGTANNRAAEVYINGVLDQTFTGLGLESYAVYEKTIDSSSPVTVRIQPSASTSSPIIINSIKVTKLSDYWVDDSFITNTANSDYLATFSTALLPTSGGIQLTGANSNFENISGTTASNDGKTSGTFVRVSGKSNSRGHVEFTVPSAGTVRIALKAKGTSNNRAAEVYVNNVLDQTFTGLGLESYAVYEKTFNSSSPITIKLQPASSTTDPIIINSIKVSKYNSSDSQTDNLSITFDKENSSPYLDFPLVSGTISDPTDPASTEGIAFKITAEDLNNVTLTATSSVTSIVSDANINTTFDKNTGIVKLFITPTGIGNTTITITASDGVSNKSQVINYYSSVASEIPNKTIFHTGISDASTAIAIDNDYYVIADDENNALRLYSRNHSGLPIKTYEDLGVFTGDGSGEDLELDLEASTKGVKYTNRLYFCGSMGNSKKGKSRPTRAQLFWFEVSGTGEQTEIKAQDVYKDFRNNLITWGDNKGYDFSACSYAADNNGVIPKRIDGFNVEGLAIAPDNTTAYVGFRAPLIPRSGETERTLALIAPVANFEDFVANKTTPVIGEPILLDLGGRSIRSIDRLSDGSYLIIAGMYDDQNNPALYLWSGNANDTPTRIEDINFAVNGEIHPEAFIEGSSSSSSYVIELISDNGTADFYNDGQEAKALNLDIRKFRKDTITVARTTTSIQDVQKEQLPVINIIDNMLTVDAITATLEIFNISGHKVAASNTNQVSVAGLKNGVYIITIYSEGNQVCTKLLLNR